MLTPARLNTNQLDRHRLGPKGTWPSSGVPNSPDADLAPPAERRDLTHSGTHAERGKPVVLPMARLLSKTEVELKGKRAARRTQGTAGMGVWKKRMPFCNRADRG
jgi:hypothetical protein